MQISRFIGAAVLALALCGAGLTAAFGSAYKSADGSYAAGTVLESGGLPVSSANPMPGACVNQSPTLASGDVAALPCTPNGDLAVSFRGGTPIDCSISITTGATAQAILPADSARRGFMVQNISTDPVGLSLTSATPALNALQTMTLNAATATAGGGAFNPPPGFNPTGAVYVVAATTGDKIFCVKW